MSTTTVVQGEHALSVSRRFAAEQTKDKGFGIVGAAIVRDVLNSGATRCAIAYSRLDDTVEITVEDNRPKCAGLAAALEQLSTVPDASSHGTIEGMALPLALAKAALVETTQGVTELDGDEFVQRGDAGRQEGLRLHLALACDEAQAEALAHALDDPLVPDGLALSVNGREVPRRSPIRTFEATLPPLRYRRDVQRCVVEVHEALPGEEAAIFEQGVLVEATGDRWHCNVLGAVPRTRRGADPQFLRRLRVLALNAAHDRLGVDDATQEWVHEATSDQDCSPEAFVWWLRARFGNVQRAAADGEWLMQASPGGWDADLQARAGGYALIRPGQLTVGQHLNLNAFHPVRFSQEAFSDRLGDGDETRKGRLRSPYDKPITEPPTGTVVLAGVPVHRLPPEDWTRQMKAVSEWFRVLAHAVTGEAIALRFVQWHLPVRAADRSWQRIASDGSTELVVPVFDDGSCDLLDGEFQDVYGKLLELLAAFLVEDRGAEAEWGVSQLAWLAAQTAFIAAGYPDFYRSLMDELP